MTQFDTPKLTPNKQHKVGMFRFPYTSWSQGSLSNALSDLIFPLSFRKSSVSEKFVVFFIQLRLCISPQELLFPPGVHSSLQPPVQSQKTDFRWCVGKTTNGFLLRFSDAKFQAFGSGRVDAGLWYWFRPAIMWHGCAIFGGFGRPLRSKLLTQIGIAPCKYTTQGTHQCHHRHSRPTTTSARFASNISIFIPVTFAEKSSEKLPLFIFSCFMSLMLQYNLAVRQETDQWLTCKIKLLCFEIRNQYAFMPFSMLPVCYVYPSWFPKMSANSRGCTSHQDVQAEMPDNEVVSI